MNEDIYRAMGTTEDEWDGHPEISDHLKTQEDIESTFEDTRNTEVEMIEQDDESDRHRDVEGVYHASQSLRCPRKWYYRDMDVVTEWPSRDWSDIFRRGDTVEDWVVTRLSDTFEHVGNALPVRIEEDDFYVTGSSDPFMLDEHGDISALTEVKSTSTDLNGIPSDSHVAQLNMYLSAIGLPFGFLVYVRTEDHADEEYIVIKEVEVVRVNQSEELLSWCMTAFDIYHEHRIDESFPPAFPMKRNECGRCDYRALCMRNDDGTSYAKEAFPPVRGGR